jgi:hypothetical protein
MVLSVVPAERHGEHMSREKHHNGQVPPDPPPPDEMAARHPPHSEDREKSTEALRRELDDHILGIYVGEMSLDWPPTASLRRVEELLHELARRGPEHALVIGFSQLSALVTQLLIRWGAHAVRDLRPLDKASHAAGRPELPASVVEQLLPKLDALGHLHLKVAESYGKFKHVLSIGDRGEPVARPPRRKSAVGHRAGRNGNGAARAGAAGGHRQKTDLRLIDPLRAARSDPSRWPSGPTIDPPGDGPDGHRAGPPAPGGMAGPA